MTVIAWDGTTLAADRACDIGGIISEVTKIRRLDGALIALAGDGTRLEQFAAWLAAGGDPAAYPKRPENNQSVCVVIARIDGKVRIQRFEATGYPMEIESAFYADGAGRDVALAAMHCGKSAHDAVLLACKLTSYCGNGVDVLELDR